jgi:hypothetical protein
MRPSGGKSKSPPWVQVGLDAAQGKQLGLGAERKAGAALPYWIHHMAHRVHHQVCLLTLSPCIMIIIMDLRLGGRQVQATVGS